MYVGHSAKHLQLTISYHHEYIQIIKDQMCTSIVQV